MRLHRLDITAFGPFGGTQHVDFDALSAAGLFLLHGPTGAGKTSVLDAVCYALYGSVPGARQGSGFVLPSTSPTAFSRDSSATSEASRSSSHPGAAPTAASTGSTKLIPCTIRTETAPSRKR